MLSLSLPIPPSVNKYLYPKVINSGKGRVFARLAETREAQLYKSKTIPIIRKEIESQKWEIPKEGEFVDVYINYHFPKKGMDPNNYLKILYDTFKVAGVYIDDDLAKPQTGLVLIDKNNPKLEIIVKKSSQVGVFKDCNKREEFISENSEKMQKRSFNALMKKLDEGRITEKVFLDENYNVKLKED